MNQVKGIPPPTASLISAGRAGLMPKPDDFLDSLSHGDPFYEIANRFHHEAWADSYGLEAEVVAGRATFTDFVDACVRDFNKAAQILVAIRDQKSVNARCQKLDNLAKLFIRKTTAEIGRQAKRLGKRKANAATKDFSKRVLVISVHSKQQIHEGALTELTSVGKDITSPGKELSGLEPPQQSAQLMHEPDFWRARRTEFDSLLARQRSMLGQETRQEWLKAYCDFSSEHGQFGRCQLRGGFDGRLISDFEDVATQAANALGCPPRVDPTAFWLYNLAKDLLKASKPQIRREFSPGGEWGGYIQGLLESSASYCSRLAAKADREGIDSARKPGDNLRSTVSALTESRTAVESTGPPQKISELSSDASRGEDLPASLVSAAGTLSPSTGLRGITHQSTRAIKLGFASNQVSNIVVPKMKYEFPEYFPDPARRKFLAARLRAEDALKEKREDVTDFTIAEELLCEFILEVFRAFGEEGHKLGMRGLLTAAQFESECLKFLYGYSVDAGLFDGNFIARIVTEVPGDIPPRIERSEQWRRYRQLLQEVADAQAADHRPTMLAPNPTGEPRERNLTETQQQRIADAERELNKAFKAHEQMRGIVDHPDWRRVGLESNERTMAGEIATLVRDIKTFAIEVLRVLAEASWPPESAEGLRHHLDVDARDILKWALGRIHKNDLPILDGAALKEALDLEISEWVKKAGKELTPWIVRTPHSSPIMNGITLASTFGVTSAPVEQATIIKGDVGRPVETRTQELHQAWVEKGRPTVTAKVCDELIQKCFPKEWSTVKRGSKGHKNLRDRTRGAVLRIERKLATKLIS